MSQALDLHSDPVLSREDENRVLQAVFNLNWSDTYVPDAEQAIGRVLNIDTSKARPILNELIGRKRLKARAKEANNLLETGTTAHMRCKWFPTSPYDAMRLKVAEILQYEANLSSTEHDFKVVVTKDDELYCGPVNQTNPVPSEVCIFTRPDVGHLTEDAVQKRIQDAENDDVEEQRQQSEAKMVDTDHWTKW